ncbi:hypothetical protein IFM61606_00548 [Aspergillus udagawae]|uniref:SnoaL-like domain-containing protein n=1 Tax=Aspergillus udagawae TaxID=91492 RepID=A0ABQ1AJK1_9EURO|nr:hypothetical protein IFM51744_06331 [Aspergillus udagawae]GFF83055.1 hypothetical protein IFM53868_03679 [Aspergillus udagawae]GFG05085.1 hypothetical protein IFM5058_02250 [Aspergillus udagawae]GFG20435.1 hypothetical protein IFM61606_00548 [Aspergillus udagawae]
MQQVYTTHEGPYESIPSTATPGLQFLKHFLPALDSLDPNANPVSPFIHPDARVFVGSGPPNRGTDVVGLLNVRQRHIQYFHHDVHKAWDIARTDTGSGSDTRTVMFEATSGTVFRNDPDDFEVRVREFNVLELQWADSQSDGDDEGKGGFVAVEMRTYMDARPVQDQAARLQRESAYGEAKSTG